MKKLFTAVFFMCISLTIASGNNRANFLSHGPSVAAFGRGEAAVSYTDDPSGVFYNPSLMSFMKRPGAYYSHFLLFEGAHYTFAGAALPYKKDYFIGFSYLNLRSGDVEIRESLVDPGTKINTNQSAVTASFSAKLKKLYDTNVGVSLKLVRQELYTFTGNSFAADIGASRRFTGPELFTNQSIIDVGASALNILPPVFKLAVDEEIFPVTYRAGASLSVPTTIRAFSSDSAAAFADLSYEDGVLNYFSGLEYSVMNKYTARAGGYKDHLTIGFGIKDNDFQIDYALDLGGYASFHKLGFGYYWGKAKSLRKKTKEDIAFMKEARLALKESKIVQKEINAKFKDAKKDYNKIRYIAASEKFEQIFLNYPKMDNAIEIFEKIDKKMKYEATDGNISNYEDISYAKGFIFYKGSKYAEAISEWQKVLQFNPKRTELESYMAKAQRYLDDVERNAKDKELEAKVSTMFAQGVSKFDAKSWIPCIKIMENVQETCRKEPFSKSLEYTALSKEYITKSLDELAKSVKTKRAQAPSIDSVKPAQPDIDIDLSGADKKYTEGLVLYAQGKTGEAINKWEIALRLNPNHERAQKAIERAKEELAPRK